jgi:hypothetical protein
MWSMLPRGTLTHAAQTINHKCASTCSLEKSSNKSRVMSHHWLPCQQNCWRNIIRGNCTRSTTTCLLCAFSYNISQSVFRWYKTFSWTCTVGTTCVWSCHASLVHGQVGSAEKSSLIWRFCVRPRPRWKEFGQLFLCFGRSPLLSSQP